MNAERLSMAWYGYDGNGLIPGDRVELHPGTDLWMRGAKYGTIQHIAPSGHATVHIDRLDATRRFHISRLRRI